jgi:hypothetical protein
MSRVRSKQLNYPLFGAFSGSFTGSFSGSITVAPISSSFGITNFFYDTSAPVAISVSGAEFLNSNRITKWSGNAFVNTTITDDGNKVIFASSQSVFYGSASFYSQENIQAANKFIVLASGSNSLTNGGLIIASSNFSGSAFYLDNTGSYGRFAVAYNVPGTASTVTADEYVATVKISSLDPSDPPTWGGTYGLGNMWINSISSSIFIWA